MYTIVLGLLLILTGSSTYCAAKDHHAVLGVKENATTREITVAYRKLTQQYHPDKNPASKQQFIEIQEAYEALIKPERNARYHQKMRKQNWTAEPLFGIAIGVCILAGVKAIDMLMKHLAKLKNEAKKEEEVAQVVQG